MSYCLRNSQKGRKLVDDLPSAVNKEDDWMYSIDLEVPKSSVVLLQGYFELHEGLGTVRTSDATQSIVTIYTGRQSLNDVFSFLKQMKPQIQWRAKSRSKND